MGMEVEELLMACEEEFGVHLNAQDVFRISTVGHLYHCIMRVLDVPKPIRCPRARVYFSLRTAMAEQCNLRKRDLKPDVRLAEILPKRGRRKAWYDLQELLPYPIPSLDTALSNRAISSISLLLGLPLGIVIAAFTVSVFESSETWGIDILAAGIFPVAVPAFLFLALSSLLTFVPPAETFGELVDIVTRRNNWGFAPDGTPWDSTSVWLNLKKIVADRFDVDATRISPETDFFKDLGAG